MSEKICKLDKRTKLNYCGKDKHLKPILRWVGGKSRVSKNIIKIMPEHSVYDEPFIGGGGLFFAKPLTEKNYINDKNSNLINMYNKIKNISQDELNKCKVKISKPEFKALFKKGKIRRPLAKWV